MLAFIDAAQRTHDAVRDVVDREPGPFLLSPFVLAELDYLLTTRVGSSAEAQLLDDVVAGTYRLETFVAEDVDVARDVIARYPDLNVGLADASIVVLAARARTDRVLTLDERHFRTMRTLTGRPFKVLPTDDHTA